MNPVGKFKLTLAWGLLVVWSVLHPIEDPDVFSLFVCLMVFNATFNIISVISWRSVLLVEETIGTGVSSH
jgi:hypothetical protein